MPPDHGAAIVGHILADAKLRAQWIQELAEMRARLNGLRKLLVDKLAARKTSMDFSFIAKERGMFSFLGITKEQVIRLARGVPRLHGGVEPHQHRGHQPRATSTASPTRSRRCSSSGARCVRLKPPRRGQMNVWRSAEPDGYGLAHAERGRHAHRCDSALPWAEGRGSIQRSPAADRDRDAHCDGARVSMNMKGIVIANVA